MEAIEQILEFTRKNKADLWGQCVEIQRLINSHKITKVFINYSDGFPTHVGHHGSSDPKTYTKNIIKRFKESGMSIISYFITEYSKDLTVFRYMYGADAVDIDPKNMLQVANTMNTKFLEKS